MILWKNMLLLSYRLIFAYVVNPKIEAQRNVMLTKWPNISENDPDHGSGSKSLILKRDHFWLDDPVKVFCFSGRQERHHYLIFWNIDLALLVHSGYNMPHCALPQKLCIHSLPSCSFFDQIKETDKMTFFS